MLTHSLPSLTPIPSFLYTLLCVSLVLYNFITGFVDPPSQAGCRTFPSAQCDPSWGSSVVAPSSTSIQRVPSLSSITLLV